MKIRSRAVPQGFTLSVAGTIGITIGRHGFPGPLNVWLFVVGAGCAFALAVLVSGAHSEPTNRPVSVTGPALLNLSPIVVVPLASTAAWWVQNNALAFTVAGAATVGLYITAQAAILVALHRLSRQ